jgi:hypothetical protein
VRGVPRRTDDAVRSHAGAVNGGGLAGCSGSPPGSGPGAWSGAAPPATVTRLTTQWQADHRAFGERDLTGSDYVHVWADGIHLRIRLSEAKSCVLVVMGVRADGTKELIMMADGYRESAESWADLLRSGIGTAPVSGGLVRKDPRRRTEKHS